MTARPGSLETLSFALELLKRIPRDRKITARELFEQLTAAGFNRDRRTVERQLVELTQQFDIERDDSSKPYGYKWKERAKGLAVPNLTEPESLLLVLAEKHLASLLPTEVLRTLAPFFQQANSNLASHHDGRGARLARAWTRKVRVVSTSQPLLPPRIDPAVFETVTRALYRDEWLQLRYRNSAGKDIEGAVMPLGLAQQGTRLYLVGRFRGYDNERSLALNRIKAVSATGEQFQRPDFDLERYDADGRFGFGRGNRIRLLLRIDKAAGVHLLESRLAADQTVEVEENTYLISATVTETEQLKWWLRGFGAQVQVLQPEHLRAAVAR